MNIMIFFFYGPNTYMLRKKLRQMTTTYIEKSGSDFGLERIDGATVTAEKLRANLQASPFLANSRLVIIENLGKNKIVNAKIERIVSDVPSTTVAVFVETEPDARTSYYKDMLKLAQPAFFEALPQSKLMSWTKSEIERFGGTAERDAINMLLDMTNGDQWRLSEEIQKVVNYDPSVTPATVTLLVEAGLDQNVFDLVDAMTGGRDSDALRVYQKLLLAREDEFKILGMIEWQLRNLLLAKAAGQIPSAELAKVAGMSPYAAGKMQTASRRYDIEILKSAYKNAVDTEDAMKKGITPSVVAVEQLIFKVASITKPQTRSI
jgi:DNA polymerase III delta subunit